ncbi:odorant receptor 49b [Plutella xylostella]|uniref:odorant receptor 49b n=1 Tax=Plutella xylostella TaxID=51655 RepID=UPI00203219BF|nr:odorant receptor 49b [Plutella xylostella]
MFLQLSFNSRLNMARETLSDTFKHNVLFWKFLGLWIFQVDDKRYRYYAIPVVSIVFVAYNILLTLNLVYTPKKLDTFIPELIFFFCEIQNAFKVHMIMFKSKQIVEVFEIMDSDVFIGEKEEHNRITIKSKLLFIKVFKIFFVGCNMSYICHNFLPLISFLVFGTELNLPVCNYYFLSDESRKHYFWWILVYQTYGIYHHMMYNLSIDTFMSGLILVGLVQCRALNHGLQNIKTSVPKKENDTEDEKRLRMELVKCIQHYESIRKYCAHIQDLYDPAMFVQMGVGAASNCVILASLLLSMPSHEKALYVSVLMYGTVMAIEILMPGYLGSQLTHESGQIVRSVYSCDWIDRPESFKSILKLLLERAKRPIILTTGYIVPLSLNTFISIMKTAYSSFTILRGIHKRT